MIAGVSHISVPAALLEVPQWVTWYFAIVNGRKTKIPRNATTGANASSTNPDDWTSFDGAMASKYPHDGVGFVFAKGGGMVGIDLDKCLDDAGSIKPWAEKIVTAFATYTEVSPSGRGLKMWVHGKLPSERGTRKPYGDGEVEMYDHSRFFTFTGNRWADSPCEVIERQRYIDGLFGKLVPPSEPSKPLPAQVLSLDDNAVIERLLTERGGKGRLLFCGNTAGYTSTSEAEAAFVCKVAFYTRDPAQIDRIVRASKLCREKWINRDDYRDMTISWALSKVTEGYDPNRASTRIKPPAHMEEDEPKPVKVPPPADSSGLQQMLEATISGQRRNMPWPWRYLTVAARALLPGTLTVLCGAAGSTKSMLVSEASIFWMDAGVPFAVFHLEEDREFHLNRALAQMANNASLTLDDFIRDNADIVRESYQEHKARLNALSGSIWDAPKSDVTTDDLIDWTRDRASEGKRIIIIDPVTAADSGSEPWAADRRFVLQTKQIMRDHGASLLVVTHPRDGNPKHGNHLDNIAGGRSYNRFTQCVLMLDAMNEQAAEIRSQFGHREQLPVNRKITIRKARSGPGAGMEIGYLFDHKTLRFNEQGQIIEE